MTASFMLVNKAIRILKHSLYQNIKAIKIFITLFKVIFQTLFKVSKYKSIYRSRKSKIIELKLKTELETILQQNQEFSH